MEESEVVSSDSSKFEVSVTKIEKAQGELVKQIQEYLEYYECLQFELPEDEQEKFDHYVGKFGSVVYRATQVYLCHG